MEKEKKIYKNKHGKEFMSLAFRCPVELAAIIETDAGKFDESVSTVIVRQLKKVYNFKG
jgi:hypothetical protein